MTTPKPLGEHDGRTLVTIRQAAAIAGVCRRTIYSWVATGKVEYIYTAGGSKRIYVDTLFKTGTTDGI